jgi:hypothetical protein
MNTRNIDASNLVLPFSLLCLDVVNFGLQLHLPKSGTSKLALKQQSIPLGSRSFQYVQCFFPSWNGDVLGNSTE